MRVEHVGIRAISVAVPRRRVRCSDFGELFGVKEVSRIVASSGMSVDIPERFLLLPKIASQLQQNHMLENVGMIPGVKSVSIAKHELESRKPAEERSLPAKRPHPLISPPIDCDVPPEHISPQLGTSHLEKQGYAIDVMRIIGPILSQIGVSNMINRETRRYARLLCTKAALADVSATLATFFPIPCACAAGRPICCC